MTRPTRLDSAIGEVSDYRGIAWLIAERRATEHGFDLCLGWPVDADGQRGVAIIITQDLADYICATRQRDVALPIGRSTIKRLRRELGLSWLRDRAAWWAERADDLANLTLEQFAQRHGVSGAAACLQRKARGLR